MKAAGKPDISVPGKPEGFLKLRSEKEEFLKSLTPAQRAIINGHSVSFCTLDGRYVPFEGEREDLFEVLGRMERYVVDTNSNWKSAAAKPQNKDKAFILTKTLTDEQEDIDGLFFGPKTDTHNDNIFLLGVFCPAYSAVPLMMLDRLDHHYEGVFDKERLLAASLPAKEKKAVRDKDYLAYRKQFENGVEQEKAVILRALGISDILQLPSPKELEVKRHLFRNYITSVAPFAVLNFEKSIDVARHCYSLLLMECERVRTEFSKPDYYNVFGDTRIIQNAVFANASILSADKGLKRMAGYAGIPCVKNIS